MNEEKIAVKQIVTPKGSKVLDMDAYGNGALFLLDDGTLSECEDLRKSTRTERVEYGNGVEKFSGLLHGNGGFCGAVMSNGEVVFISRHSSMANIPAEFLDRGEVSGGSAGPDGAILFNDAGDLLIPREMSKRLFFSGADAIKSGFGIPIPFSILGSGSERFLMYNLKSKVDSNIADVHQTKYGISVIMDNGDVIGVLSTVERLFMVHIPCDVSKRSECSGMEIFITKKGSIIPDLVIDKALRGEHLRQDIYKTPAMKVRDKKVMNMSERLTLFSDGSLFTTGFNRGYYSSILDSSHFGKVVSIPTYEKTSDIRSGSFTEEFRAYSLLLSESGNASVVMFP